MINEFKELDLETKIVTVATAGAAVVGTVAMVVIYKKYTNNLLKGYLNGLHAANKIVLDHNNEMRDLFIKHLSTLAK